MLRGRVPVISAAIALAAMSACTTSQRTHTAEANRPVPNAWDPGSPEVLSAASAAPAAPAAPVAAVPGRIQSSYAFPTGHVDTSVLLMERDLPAEILSGQEFSYDMKVTNIGHTTLTGVAVHDDCASQMTLIRSEPATASQEPPFVWTLGELKPDESRIVHVTGRLTGTGEFTSCASATLNPTLCLTSPAVQPALRLTIDAPAEATPCDTIPVRLSVTNTGTGEARNVRLVYALPEGWTTAQGETSAQFVVDSLAANKSREFVVDAQARRTGDFASKATVTASPGLKADGEPVSTAVRQAVLAVTAKGPETVYLGRPAVLEFSVTNTGTAPATAATVAAPVPAGTRFLAATENGKFAAGKVTWNLETLPVKASRTLSMTLQAESIGSFDTPVTAGALCAVTGRDAVRVSALGISALLLEVTDLLDPVEIGSATDYEIVITNQGSAAATNVKIVVTLEDTQEFLSATGAKARVAGDTITFDPIPSIAPKDKATLVLAVTCVKQGDARFKVSMTADQLGRPVEETESTHIYR